MIKSRRMRSARHVAYMGEKNNIYGVFGGGGVPIRDQKEYLAIGAWIILKRILEK
jgi:hypothetical protein